jgi:hypothetical protein
MIIADAPGDRTAYAVGSWALGVGSRADRDIGIRFYRTAAKGQGTRDKERTEGIRVAMDRIFTPFRDGFHIGSQTWG